MKGLQYEMVRASIAVFRLYLVYFLPQRRLNACVGAGLIAKINPTPIPETLQRVRDAVENDSIEALDSIKIALTHRFAEIKPVGWWICDRPVQAVFPPQSVSVAFFRDQVPSVHLIRYSTMHIRLRFPGLGCELKRQWWNAVRSEFGSTNRRRQRRQA